MREADLLSRQLRRMQALRREEQRADADWHRRSHELTRWQAQRWQTTHRDLHEHPRSRPAIAFFFEQIYSPRDFSRRDHELERIAPLAAKVLPAHGVRTLALSLEMNVLTQELDAALLAALEAEPGFDGILTEERYLAAYRRCDDRPRRARQIELINVVGDDLDATVARPMVHAALKLAEAPARLAGLGELHALLAQGCIAFRKVGGARRVLRTIVRREKRILERIYDRHPRPFELAE